MIDSSKGSHEPWSIVLAGGDGRRIRGFVQRWLGRPRPKQYCAFVGERSLFQHTVDRASALCSQDRIVALVAREHREEAWAQLEGRGAGTVLLQPKQCETAAGLYLSLTYIRAKDPLATVVVYPADHFVYPEDRFVACVHRALWTLEWLPDRLVVLGVCPDRLELDYGWIMPGTKLDESAKCRIHEVRSFMDKPTVVQADAALAGGALWNTGVVAAKADTLWQLGWQCFPQLMERFERLGAAIGSSQEVRIPDEVYRDLPADHAFSELLHRMPDRACVIEMSGVLWSDWSKPEQIAHMLRRIGRQPAFPLHCLRRPFAPIPQLAYEAEARAGV